MTKHAFKPLEFTEHDEAQMLDAVRDFYRQVDRRRTVREFSARPVPREIISGCGP